MIQQRRCSLPLRTKPRGGLLAQWQQPCLGRQRVATDWSISPIVTAQWGVSRLLRTGLSHLVQNGRYKAAIARTVHENHVVSTRNRFERSPYLANACQAQITGFERFISPGIGPPMWTYVLPPGGSSFLGPGLGLRPNSGGLSLCSQKMDRKAGAQAVADAPVHLPASTERSGCTSAEPYPLGRYSRCYDTDGPSQPSFASNSRSSRR
jgi:hypothetical protein